MANGHGGKRKPAKPAAVSGPGKYSQRTDGFPKFDVNGDAKIYAQPVDPAQYDPNQDYTKGQDQGVIEVPDLPKIPPPPTDLKFDVNGKAIIPFGEPSQRPNELETEGSPFGYGSFIRPRLPFFDDEGF